MRRSARRRSNPAAQLSAIKVDKIQFGKLYAKMQGPNFKKDKAAQVAALYTGARATAFKSKPSALKAIKQKFEDRAILASKEKMNENVTPW